MNNNDINTNVDSNIVNIKSIKIDLLGFVILLFLNILSIILVSYFYFRLETVGGGLFGFDFIIWAPLVLIAFVFSIILTIFSIIIIIKIIKKNKKAKFLLIIHIVMLVILFINTYITITHFDIKYSANRYIKEKYGMEVEILHINIIDYGQAWIKARMLSDKKEFTIRYCTKCADIMKDDYLYDVRLNFNE